MAHASTADVSTSQSAAPRLAVCMIPPAPGTPGGPGRSAQTSNTVTSTMPTPTATATTTSERCADARRPACLVRAHGSVAHHRFMSRPMMIEIS